MRFVKSLIISACVAFSLPTHAEAQHGIAMHGAPKYDQNFKHFDRVNPDAPKGGNIVLAEVGSFDSLNPLILKGHPAAGVRELTLESLLKRSPDEPFSLYGLLAESIEVAPDRSWVIFSIRPEARWHDGTPITAKDVAFSHQIQLEKGTANRRMYYKKVKSVEVLGDRKVKMTFNKQDGEYDRELPLTMGLMTIIPEHIYSKQGIEKTGLKPLMGSGAYKVSKVNAGRAVTYERDPNYWGKDLAVNKGFNNFDHIQYDYYRNASVLFEALKARKISYRHEIDSAKWNTNYNFKAIQDGSIIKTEVSHKHQVGMHAFAFNTRNPLFGDPKVRRALTFAFDFDWLNKSLQHGAMDRTVSYFDNTELASKGLPEGKELELLAEFKDQLPEEVFTTEYSLPSFAKQKRANIAKAQHMLKDAGWHLENSKLTNNKTGQDFTFEILLNQPENEKLALAFARDLKRLGITAKVRTVDPSQYENRRVNKDFDMIITLWGHTLSPGGEQQYYWTSKAADQPGTRNYSGIKCPAVDVLCQKITRAETREDLVAAVKALDRVLLNGHYVIPFGHRSKDYVVYSKKIDHPKFGPEGIPEITLWWKNSQG